jgi:drug/metabolite transporter (DMT)-like permease
LRWTLAVPFLIAIVWWKERKLLPPLKAVPYLIAIGLTGVSLFNVFTYMALRQTSPDDVGLFSALNPITIAVASFIFLKERIAALQLMGMLLSGHYRYYAGSVDQNGAF